LSVQTRSFIEELRPLLRLRWLQLCALVTVLTGVGAIALQLKFSVLDLDIWWHLKVGDWIIEHLAVPHTGILSRTAANRPWVAYSWGYEVLLSRAYAWFGLLGMGILGTFLTLAVAYAIYWMLRRLSGRFWTACVLTGVVCSAFLFNGMPRPFFFSMVLFAIALTLLLEANRSGRGQALYWLPPIFLLWANLHIQFIYGLFLVGLFAGVLLGQRLANTLGIAPGFLLPPTLPARNLVVLSVVCILATLVGPNFYHPYVAVYEYSKAKFAYSVIQELQPLTFRWYNEYAELLLTAAGFFAVGWQKKLDPFKLALLTVASVVAFRTMRDAWFICIPAAACIADLRAPEAQGDRPRYDGSESWYENAGVAVAVVVLLAAFSRGTDFNQRSFDRVISAQYPVNAVNFLRRNPVPGPLYNNLNWGGFLMWYMPDYPVAIDGRNDLYGDDLDRLFFNSQNADTSYTTDPYLNEAGVVLLDSQLPLAKILTVDPRFQLVFHDEIATVFARRRDAPDQ
jgi:type II secretory pathway pseudopilin PulG